MFIKYKPILLIFFITIIIIVNGGMLQSYNQYSNASALQFVQTANQINKHIFSMRNRLLKIHKNFLKNKLINFKDIIWLNELYLYVNLFDPIKNKNWQKLLLKVGTLPKKALQEQIYLSTNYLHSTNTILNSNIFNLSCSYSLCQTLLKGQSTYGHELILSHYNYFFEFTPYIPKNNLKPIYFMDPSYAIDVYIHLLDSNHAYDKFRRLRYQRELAHRSVINWERKDLKKLINPERMYNH